MQRKFHGFLYISSALTIVPSILMDSYFPALQTCEYFYLTTLKFLSLSDSSDMHQTSLMQILVSATEPFVGLLGPDPGSKLS